MHWTLITGGALRLGAEICRSLAQSGKSIAIHYYESKTEAEALQKELVDQGAKVQVIQGDFSTREGVDAFLERYLMLCPHTDALINNVGPFQLGSALTASAEKMQALFQLNTLAPLLLVQALLPSLKVHKGHVINIGMAGAEQPAARSHAFAYDLTKLSLAMLTKSLAKECAPAGVCVNMISPGYLEESLDIPKRVTEIPLGRPGRFKDVAEAVLFFLASDYITGQNLEVAGGTRL